MHQTIQAARESRFANEVISRFAIVLFGAVLIGMGAGQQLRGDLADLCGMVGLLSLACYAALELVARNRDREHAAALQHAAEARLGGSAATP